MASLRRRSLCLSPFHIGDTAVREVFEETGVRSEFRSLLSIRQQHRSPGAFGMSDMYLVCRLQPLSFTINFCQQECLKCEWMDLEDLARTKHTTPITSRVARLLLYGHREGFDKIDLSMEEVPAVYTGLFYKLYHRELPESYRAAVGTDWVPDFNLAPVFSHTWYSWWKFINVHIFKSSFQCKGNMWTRS